MREFMIGLIAVGIFAGVMLGRSTERARRSYRDQATSKVTFQKYRKTAVVEARKAVFTVAPHRGHPGRALHRPHQIQQLTNLKTRLRGTDGAEQDGGDVDDVRHPRPGRR